MHLFKYYTRTFSLTCFRLLVLSLLISGSIYALDAPTGVEVLDTPDDNGTSIQIIWKPSVSATGYHILRREDQTNEEPSLVGEVSVDQVEVLKNGLLRYTDKKNIRSKTNYRYQVMAVKAIDLPKTGTTNDPSEMTSSTTELRKISDETPSIQAKGNLFHTKKTWVLVFILLFTSLTLVFIQMARSGREMFVRNISALNAVEESVGRSTEMGRPIFFVPGLEDISNPATIAAINIFESVAQQSINDQTRIVAPCRDPIVMNVMQNSLQQVCAATGRPEMYNQDDVFFVTDRQFAYVAAVDGMIMRDQPATVFLQGYFYAESLILAEVSQSVGAVQIAGTSSDTQLPFFIAACDYTLIGEELFAAGAYIKRDSLQLGTLKAQDLVKLLLFILMTLGSLLVLIDVSWVLNLFSTDW